MIKVSKQSIWDSEERYRLITENVRDSISIIGSGFKIEYVNPSYLKLLGYSRDELIGRRALENIHPADVDNIKNYLRELFRKAEGTVELRIKKKNGEYIWVESKGSVFFDEQKKTKLLSVSRDITEQKALEDALKIKSADSTLLVDLETRNIIESNPSLQHLLGYTSEEILKLGLYEIFSLEREALDRKILQIIKEKSTFFGEQVIKMRDGNLVDVEVRANLIVYSGKRVLYIIFRDITIQKLMEKKLEESERKYREIIENVKDAVVIIGFDGKFHYQSPQFAKLLGREEIGDDLTTVGQYIHKDDIEALLDAFQESAGRIAILSLPEVEFRALHRDGHYAWLASSTKAHYNEDGSLDGYLVTLRDITEQKITIEKLEDSEEKYRELFENSPNSIILMDINGIIRDCNLITIQYFGFEKEDLIGSGFGEISSILVEKAEDKSKGKITEPIELLLHKKDGSLLWASLEASIVELANELFIQAIVQDITPRKLAEQKLKESEEEMREKTKLAAVGQLAAGVAHELNTPLANINLTAEYLLEFTEKSDRLPDPEALKKEILDIKNQVRFCANIVQDLLQFSRKIEINLERLSITSLLTELIGSPSILKKFKENNVLISLEIREDIEIMGDRTLLSQVIQNLLENSIDAFEEIQRQPKVTIKLLKINDRVEITVKDNGKGIKKENLARIFEPFFTTKAVGKGTGLGLSISRGIIEKHSGELTIRSIYGKGAEAKIILPGL
ncbi:MAG: PAS domain S-box protein [Candidatus Helarchaeota archaeon]|nr:PAS domain S-box protein [Candidatus Helarchaeota archaeon]